MARPSRCRRVCAEPVYCSFAPQGAAADGTIQMTVDEYEVIRLVDMERKTHEQCAAQMQISRTTVTEIYESARSKIADSMIHGRALVISGGHYRVCQGAARHECDQKNCPWAASEPPRPAAEQTAAGEARPAL